MFEITVKWPTGKVATCGGFDGSSAPLWADFLWEAGADDVIIRCVCGECETCRDRAVFESGA